MEQKRDQPWDSNEPSNRGVQHARASDQSKVAAEHRHLSADGLLSWARRPFFAVFARGFETRFEIYRSPAPDIKMALAEPMMTRVTAENWSTCGRTRALSVCKSTTSEQPRGMEAPPNRLRLDAPSPRTGPQCVLLATFKYPAAGFHGPVRADISAMREAPVVHIVDDDAGIRRSMDSLLRSAGFEVATYRSATEFLQAAHRRRHGCLVLDVGLPGLSGLDLQRELLTANVRIPIVFVTGYADVPTSVRAMKAGAIEFLTKPFDDDALLDAIREAIDRDLDSETDEAYEKQLEAAAHVQQGLMRLSVPRLGFAAVAGANQPCTEVGGDFYTAIAVDECVFVAIADVAGKGVAAAVMACLLQGMLVEGAKSGVALTEIARTANEFFSQRDLGTRYATCIILYIRPDGRSDLLNCAHVPPVIVRRGEVHRLRETNLPVGLVPSAQYESCNVNLSPGDRVLLATDGVTEAENSAGVFFGDERLENAVAMGLSPEQILASVREFCTNRAFSDDCTLLDVRYLGTETTVQADLGMGDQSAIPTTARSVE